MSDPSTPAAGLDPSSGPVVPLVARDDAPRLCSDCDAAAEFVVLGADQALGHPGEAACEFHLAGLVARVSAPASVWPA